MIFAEERKTVLSSGPNCLSFAPVAVIFKIHGQILYTLMYTHKRGRETNIIVEIELGQFLGYQKDSKLKFVTISGKNQTKILVPFAPLPPLSL